MKKDKHDSGTGDNKQEDIKKDELKASDGSEKGVDSFARQADSEEREKLQNKISELEKEIDGYRDKLLRKAAEFENYKRRTESDQFNLLKYAAESFIVKLLPVVDDFERSLQHMNDAKDVESIKEGIRLVYDKLMKLLKDQGVTKIESVGKSFDVDFHEALMQRTAQGVPSHTVLDEVETGYMYKDRVIRHAKVIVSDDSGDEAIGTDDNGNNENQEDKGN